MRRSLILVAAMMPLAACNGSAPAGNSGSTTTTTTTATTVTVAPVSIKPGKWEHSVQIVDMQSPDMPPAVAAAMKERMGKPMVVNSCITAAQAAKGASTFVMPDSMKKLDCHFAKAEMANGQISSEMTCNMPSGTMTTRSTGTYSATEYSVDGEITQTGRTNLTEKTHTTGRWLGECSGGDDAK